MHKLHSISSALVSYNFEIYNGFSRFVKRVGDSGANQPSILVQWFQKICVLKMCEDTKSLYCYWTCENRRIRHSDITSCSNNLVSNNDSNNNSNQN